MSLVLQGRARRLGDRVNTDYIISSSRKKETLDPHALKRWLLESVDPDFAATVEVGDLLVAGESFGCGSAMEVAVTVVQAAGIRAVVAKSFSRTYFRNAVNNGLLPVECDTGAIEEGDRVHVEVEPGRTEVRVEPGDGASRDAGAPAADGSSRAPFTLSAAPFPPFVLDILAAGGLVAWLRGGGAFGDPR